MLLAIDIGNTNTVIGLDDGQGGWARQWRLTTISSQAADDWAALILTLAAHDGIALSGVTSVCICSVVPKAALGLSEFARGRLGIEPLFVRSDLELNIRLGMDHPAEVGADRIANAAAAWESCKSAVIVVDLGTATKVEAISEDGTFEGGSIAAGLGVTLDALASRAARLFTVQLANPVSAIGRNTTEALQAGLVRGHLHMIRGLIADIRGELGESTPILVTGGHAAEPNSPSRGLGQYEPDLTLNGIRLIHRLNSQAT
jgi:type III pantothenate kinase